MSSYKDWQRDTPVEVKDVERWDGTKEQMENLVFDKTGDSDQNERQLATTEKIEPNTVTYQFVVGMDTRVVKTLSNDEMITFMNGEFSTEYHTSDSRKIILSLEEVCKLFNASTFTGLESDAKRNLIMRIAPKLKTTLDITPHKMNLTKIYLYDYYSEQYTSLTSLGFASEKDTYVTLNINDLLNYIFNNLDRFLKEDGTICILQVPDSSTITSYIFSSLQWVFNYSLTLDYVWAKKAEVYSIQETKALLAKLLVGGSIPFDTKPDVGISMDVTKQKSNPENPMYDITYIDEGVSAISIIAQQTRYTANYNNQEQKATELPTSSDLLTKRNYGYYPLSVQKDSERKIDRKVLITERVPEVTAKRYPMTTFRIDILKMLKDVISVDLTDLEARKSVTRRINTLNLSMDFSTKLNEVYLASRLGDVYESSAIPTKSLIGNIGLFLWNEKSQSLNLISSAKANPVKITKKGNNYVTTRGESSKLDGNLKTNLNDYLTEDGNVYLTITMYDYAGSTYTQGEDEVKVAEKYSCYPMYLSSDSFEQFNVTLQGEVNMFSVFETLVNAEKTYSLLEERIKSLETK